MEKEKNDPWRNGPVLIRTAMDSLNTTREKYIVFSLTILLKLLALLLVQGDTTVPNLDEIYVSKVGADYIVEIRRGGAVAGQPPGQPQSQFAASNALGSRVDMVRLGLLAYRLIAALPLEEDVVLAQKPAAQLQQEIEQPQFCPDSLFALIKSCFSGIVATLPSLHEFHRFVTGAQGRGGQQLSCCHGMSCPSLPLSSCPSPPFASSLVPAAPVLLEHENLAAIRFAMYAEIITGRTPAQILLLKDILPPLQQQFLEEWRDNRVRDSSPFHMAIECATMAAIAELWDILADISAPSVQGGKPTRGLLLADKDGATPIHLAVRYHAGAGLGKLLLAVNTADLKETAKMTDKSGQQLLHMLVTHYTESDVLRVVQLILDAVEDPAVLCAHADAMKRTPLHYAVLYQSGDIVLELTRIMLSRAPESAALQDVDGNTPLHLAASCQGGDTGVQLVRVLVREHKPALEMRNADNLTPLNVAEEENGAEVALVHELRRLQLGESVIVNSADKHRIRYTAADVDAHQAALKESAAGSGTAATTDGDAQVVHVSSLFQLLSLSRYGCVLSEAEANLCLALLEEKPTLAMVPDPTGLLPVYAAVINLLGPHVTKLFSALLRATEWGAGARGIQVAAACVDAPGADSQITLPPLLHSICKFQCGATAAAMAKEVLEQFAEEQPARVKEPLAQQLPLHIAASNIIANDLREVYALLRDAFAAARTNKDAYGRTPVDILEQLAVKEPEVGELAASKADEAEDASDAASAAADVPRTGAAAASIGGTLRRAV